MEQIGSETLRTSSYFLELTDAELEWLRRNADVLHKPKDSVVLLEGAESPGLLVILSGSVKVCRIASSRREQVLRVANPGDSLNDVPVFDGGNIFGLIDRVTFEWSTDRYAGPASQLDIDDIMQVTE